MTILTFSTDKNDKTTGLHYGCSATWVDHARIRITQNGISVSGFLKGECCHVAYPDELALWCGVVPDDFRCSMSTVDPDCIVVRFNDKETINGN